MNLEISGMLCLEGVDIYPHIIPLQNYVVPGPVHYSDMRPGATKACQERGHGKVPGSFLRGGLGACGHVNKGLGFQVPSVIT